jgi:hypothetical protein
MTVKIILRVSIADSEQRVSARGLGDRSAVVEGRGGERSPVAASAGGRCLSCCCYCWHGFTKFPQSTVAARWANEMSMGAEGSRLAPTAAAVGPRGGGMSSLPSLAPPTSPSGTTSADRRSTDRVASSPSAGGPASSPGTGRGGGALSSPSSSTSPAKNHNHRQSSAAVNFPNACGPHCREMEASAWTLLHQCNLDRWKDGHAGWWN